MTNKHSASTRLTGLDVARYLAFVGMVIVNFKIVMGADTVDHWLNAITGILEGKAAATFVVLAGVGLGLAKQNGTSKHRTGLIIRRALFLLVLGLANMLIFDADIIHYYAFYFLLGSLFLSASKLTLVAAIAFSSCLSVVMILTLDYDKGWDWENLTYLDFWTLNGFVRNLFFNGWHPVLPWLGFVLFGLLLSRMPLGEPSTQKKLMFTGITTLLFAEGLAIVLVNLSGQVDPELALLTTTGPIPPMPLFVIAGLASASATIGFCLYATNRQRQSRLVKLVTHAGRQTLTLYIAHIMIGMGVLTYLGKVGNQSPASALVAALLFCLCSTVFACFWMRTFKHGPIESAMHRITG